MAMKSISITFDTVIEMIEDDTLSSGMTATCLGYEDINDHNGGVYRIFSSLDSDSDKNEDDITFTCNDKLYARKIDNGIIDKINELINKLDEIEFGSKQMSAEISNLTNTVNLYKPTQLNNNTEVTPDDSIIVIEEPVDDPDYIEDNDDENIEDGSQESTVENTESEVDEPINEDPTEESEESNEPLENEPTESTLEEEPKE